MSVAVRSMLLPKTRCSPIKFAFGKCVRCGKDMEGGPGHQRSDTMTTVHPECCMVCDGTSHRERAS